MLVANAAAGLECEAGLVNLPQDVVHGVADGSRHRAVDRGGRRLVLQRARVGSYASGGNGAAAQRPEESLVPVFPHLFTLDVGQRPRDTLVGIVHRLVDGSTVFGAEAVFLVPDIQRCFLERNRIDVLRLDLHDGIHVSAALRFVLARLPYGSQGIRSARKFAERRVPGLPARCSAAGTPEPPRTRDLVEPPGGHKILCRGTEPNERSRRRQDSRTYFRRQKYAWKNMGLRARSEE